MPSVALDILGPAMALGTRVLYGVAVVIPPIIAVWLLLWKNVPPAAIWLEQQEQSVAFEAKLLIGMANWVGRYASIWTPLPFAILYCLITGRFAWLLGSHEARADR